MSIIFVLLGLLGVVTGLLAILKPGYVFRRENVMFAGDEELTDAERFIVRRGAGVVTLLVGLVFLFVGTL